MVTKRNTQDETTLHAQLQYVEKVGQIFETFGMTPMIGRILGWLLICDPPDQSMNDLTEVLGASKGSISTSLQMLTSSSLIERASIPGERRRYYRVRPDAWREISRLRMKHLNLLTDLAREGLALMDDLDLQPRYRLEEMLEFYEFFEHEFPKIFEKWEEENNKR